MKLKFPIDSIKVANRFRKDLGDIKALASSIVAVGGLMHPIVVNESRQLIAGQRRLEACKLLGWKDVPVTILNLKEIMAGEFYENTARKSFTMSERIAILEEIEKLRIGHRKGKGAKLAPFQNEHKNKKSRDIVAQLTGISHGQLTKEKLIVKAAKDNPDKFAILISKIDSGKISVDGAYKEVRDESWRAQQLAENGKHQATDTDTNKSHLLLEADIKGLASKSWEKGKVDLIFADPPYDRKSLPLYKDLAKLAAKVLRPGGSLIMYIGQYSLIEILDYVKAGSGTGGLTYWWQFSVLHAGPFARYFDRQIVVKWKPLLWFVKGSRPINPSFPKSVKDGKKNFLSDLIVSKAPDKRFHNWSQSTTEAEYVIKYLTAPNDLVLDPFLGGGTTAIACRNLQRRFIGIDIDSKAIELTRANLRLTLS